MLQILSRIELRKYYDDTESPKVKCCFLEENIFNFGSLWKVLSNDKQPYNFPSLGTFLRKSGWDVLQTILTSVPHSPANTGTKPTEWRRHENFEMMSMISSTVEELVAIIHILCPAVVCLHGRLVKFVCKPNYYLQRDWDSVLSLIRLDGY